MFYGLFITAAKIIVAKKNNLRRLLSIPWWISCCSLSQLRLIARHSWCHLRQVVLLKHWITKKIPAYWIAYIHLKNLHCSPCSKRSPQQQYAFCLSKIEDVFKFVYTGIETKSGPWLAMVLQRFVQLDLLVILQWLGNFLIRCSIYFVKETPNPCLERVTHCFGRGCRRGSTAFRCHCLCSCHSRWGWFRLCQWTGATGFRRP